MWRSTCLFGNLVNKYAPSVRSWKSSDQWANWRRKLRWFDPLMCVRVVAVEAGTTRDGYIYSAARSWCAGHPVRIVTAKRPGLFVWRCLRNELHASNGNVLDVWPAAAAAAAAASHDADRCRPGIKSGVNVGYAVPEDARKLATTTPVAISHLL